MRQTGDSKRDLTQIGRDFKMNFLEINLMGKKAKRLISEFDFYLKHWNTFDSNQKVNIAQTYCDSVLTKTKDFHAKDFPFFCLVINTLFIMPILTVLLMFFLDVASRYFDIVKTMIAVIDSYIYEILVTNTPQETLQDDIMFARMCILMFISTIIVFLLHKIAMLPYKIDLKIRKRTARILFNLLDNSELLNLQSNYTDSRWDYLSYIIKDID